VIISSFQRSHRTAIHEHWTAQTPPGLQFFRQDAADHYS
jgi:hypothetical protein